MKRSLEKDLDQWKNQHDRKPLIIRGARQVGKTFLVEDWGSRTFHQAITINFDFQPELKSCFDSLDPNHILIKLEAHTGRSIQPGKDLLFIDEIQESPQAIQALRYFKERLPEQHIIAAGSLLEFALKAESLHMPVGRVQYLFLNPMSFHEFLQASGQQALMKMLAETSLTHPLDEDLHERLLTLCREYAVLGGMPAVLSSHLQTQNWRHSQTIQRALISTYRDDFAKYARQSQHTYLKMIFDGMPAWLGQPLKYSKISQEARSRDLKVALELLEDAGLLHAAYDTKASLPLRVTEKRKKNKLYFIDVGLAQSLSGLSPGSLLDPNTLLTQRGPLTEQWVAQNLLAHRPSDHKRPLHFWSRDQVGSQAEVDFVETLEDRIIPIEVKSGATGRLKSLHLMMAEYQLPLGIQISPKPLSQEGNILCVPFYLLSELSRLVQASLPSS